MEWTLLFVLAMIAYEDFRFRAIHWYWLALFFLGVVCLYPFQPIHTVANLCFCGIQFLVVKLYFSLKEKSPVPIADRYIGWGDILLMAILCFLFNFHNMVLFIVASFALTLLLFFTANHFVKPIKNIPLAGALALYLSIAIVLRKLSVIDLFRGDVLMKNIFE